MDREEDEGQSIKPGDLIIDMYDGCPGLVVCEPYPAQSVIKQGVELILIEVWWNDAITQTLVDINYVDKSECGSFYELHLTPVKKKYF